MRITITMILLVLLLLLYIIVGLLSLIPDIINTSPTNMCTSLDQSFHWDPKSPTQNGGFGHGHEFTTGRRGKPWDVGGWKMKIRQQEIRQTKRNRETLLTIKKSECL